MSPIVIKKWYVTLWSCYQLIKHKGILKQHCPAFIIHFLCFPEFILVALLLLTCCLYLGIAQLLLSVVMPMSLERPLAAKCGSFKRVLLHPGIKCLRINSADECEIYQVA